MSVPEKKQLPDYRNFRIEYYVLMQSPKSFCAKVFIHARGPNYESNGEIDSDFAMTEACAVEEGRKAAHARIDEMLCE